MNSQELLPLARTIISALVLLMRGRNRPVSYMIEPILSSIVLEPKTSKDRRLVIESYDLLKLSHSYSDSSAGLSIIPLNSFNDACLKAYRSYRYEYSEVGPANRHTYYKRDNNILLSIKFFYMCCKIAREHFDEIQKQEFLEHQRLQAEISARVYRENLSRTQITVPQPF